jgi:hypothetical protein
MEFVIFVMVLILLDLAAIRWGVDSRDSIHNLEWERRQPTHRA